MGAEETRIRRLPERTSASMGMARHVALASTIVWSADYDMRFYTLVYRSRNDVLATKHD